MHLESLCHTHTHMLFDHSVSRDHSVEVYRSFGRWGRHRL